MKRFRWLLSLFLFGGVIARAAELPSVLVIGDDPRFEACLALRISEKLLFYPLSGQAPVVKYAPVKGISDAVERFDSLVQHEFDVLAVCCRCDERQDTLAVKRLLHLAAKRQMETLWFGHDGGYVSQLGVCVADYHGACRSLAADDVSRRVEYIAEALTQWWTGTARNNHGIERIPLWTGFPPFYEDVGPEYINSVARIDRVSIPELEIFLPRQREKKSPAVIFFPGGGYSFTGFARNAREFAELAIPKGVAVIGVKYRVKRGADVALADAERAVRLVRSHAAEWNIDPDFIGVAGQSAGANIVLNLSTRYTPGDPEAVDRVERESSRPDFVVPLTVWNFGKNDYPFEFDSATPPFFVRQARNDSSFRLAEAMVSALCDAGVAVDYRFVDEGGHGAFEISGPQEGHNWPEELFEWLRKIRNY
ncbi:MAG TPA: alpha/beta hydrolase [Candidatus Alistipes intestinipullorum]|nr:alpha/beta hydrolase [Candidatus Alistipes intestinipullorum]